MQVGKEGPDAGSRALGHLLHSCLLYTSYETGNVDAVMDGDLDGFIFAYLKAASRGELQDT